MLAAHTDKFLQQQHRYIGLKSTVRCSLNERTLCGLNSAIRKWPLNGRIRRIATSIPAGRAEAARRYRHKTSKNCAGHGHFMDACIAHVCVGNRLSKAQTSGIIRKCLAIIERRSTLIPSTLPTPNVGTELQVSREAVNIYNECDFFSVAISRWADSALSVICGSVIASCKTPLE
jgi:hypothetical protein